MAKYLSSMDLSCYFVWLYIYSYIFIRDSFIKNNIHRFFLRKIKLQIVNTPKKMKQKIFPPEKMKYFSTNFQY